MAEAAWRRRRGVDAEGVLGHEAAVAGDEPDLARPFAQHLRGSGDGVHHVVVERAAAEGQAAGDRERTIFAKAEFLRGDLHGGGKAAVEVDVVDVGDPDLREFQAAGASDANCGRTVQIVAVGHGVGVVRLGTRPRMDPLALRHGQAAGRLHRTQNQRRGLVHVAVGVHQLRVRKGDSAVEAARLADFLRRLRIAQPSVGIVRGDAAEARPEFGYPRHVRRQRLAPGMANGVLEDRIHLDRLGDAALRLDAVAHLQLHPEAPIRLSRRVAPLEFDSAAPRLRLGAPALGADQHDDAAFAALNLQRRFVQHRLHRVAAPGGNASLRLRTADGLRHRLGRIPIGPHAADRAHRIHLPQQRRNLGIRGGLAHGVDHQVQRFGAVAARRVRVALFELRDADQHRHGSVCGHGRHLTARQRARRGTRPHRRCRR